MLQAMMATSPGEQPLPSQPYYLIAICFIIFIIIGV